MSKKKIQLSDHFDYSRLIRFVLPCIGTMLFTSIYGIVDGLCVSNFVGKTAFAAVNLIMPVPMLVGTVGFMLGTGGSAIVGITLGEGDNAKADRYFSLFMSTALIAGIVLSVLGMLLLRPVAMMLGAEGEMLDYALRYGRVLMLSLPTFILQNMFQSFFVTAEKPHLAFTSRWARAAPTWCWMCCWWASCTGAWRVPPLPPCSARWWAACCRCSTSSTGTTPAASTCAVPALRAKFC